ncbi:phenazine biosynthesis protein PhzF family [Paenibacillus uliginis N3/975]|uniref:Phenazine biosynthesis protein PhzF family n=1 Tax=Paenibacillus uliginis N3/975 TaxID=1313296 RepID=A0A1X7H7N9_9BACL|nr:phenazine biosynthesis protein PhzF family [Paenibacillus uliginis N3/975]
MRVTVYHVDAFSVIANQGNPAGVVLDADQLKPGDMQKIAFQVGFNETVFVLKSEIADLKLKYYTPGHEINLCGHATIASLYCLKTRGFFEGRDSIQIETNGGILPISFNAEDHLIIGMKQQKPEFIPFGGDTRKLAESMGLTEDCLDVTKPIVYGSTGIWTLLVPIRQLDSFKIMKPNNKQFPEILAQNPKASVHPFCFETYDENAFMHARHFSSPYSGTVEDPVTGTASGVMGAYYLTYIDQDLNDIQFIVEQGQEINRDGKVHVHAIRQNEMDIFISGTAVLVKEFEVEYPLLYECDNSFDNILWRMT